jgi:hypothetical protein
MKSKIKQLEEELHEQCVLNGKGSEREAALLAKVERLERENAALRADRERLDWLALCPDKRLSTVHDLWVNDGNIADMRAAIDRCRKEVQL